MAVRVHRDDRREILDFKFPDGLRRAELFQQVNIAHLFDALSQHLRRTTDRVQIHAAEFLARRERFFAHAALADDAADAKVADDLRLIRLFADEVVGPAAVAFQVPSSCFITTGPQ